MIKGSSRMLKSLSVKRADGRRLVVELNADRTNQVNNT